MTVEALHDVGEFGGQTESDIPQGSDIQRSQTCLVGLRQSLARIPTSLNGRRLGIQRFSRVAALAKFRWMHSAEWMDAADVACTGPVPASPVRVQRAASGPKTPSRSRAWISALAHVFSAPGSADRTRFTMAPGMGPKRSSSIARNLSARPSVLPCSRPSVLPCSRSGGPLARAAVGGGFPSPPFRLRGERTVPP